MNRLEIALMDTTGGELDFYLEIEKTEDIMRDIKEIQRNVAVSTPAGEMKERILAILNDYE